MQIQTFLKAREVASLKKKIMTVGPSTLKSPRINTNRFASAVRLSDDQSRVHQPQGNLLYKLCRVIFLYLTVLKVNN